MTPQQRNRRMPTFIIHHALQSTQKLIYTAYTYVRVVFSQLLPRLLYKRARRKGMQEILEWTGPSRQTRKKEKNFHYLYYDCCKKKGK